MSTTVLDPIIITPEDKQEDKNIQTENSNIQNAESLVDKLQLLGMLPGPQKFYYQFFTANAGLVTSFGDLVDKIDNGTDTRSDYIDVLKDITAVGTGAVGLATLITGSTPALPILVGVGIGLSVLDYLDSKDYNLIAIKNEFLNQIEDITNNQQNKYEAWENLSPEKRAEWINSGGTQLDYDPIFDQLKELNNELEEKIKLITDELDSNKEIDNDQYIKDAEHMSGVETDITQEDVDNSTKYTDSGEIVSDGFVEYEQSVEEQKSKRAQEEEEYIKENKDSDIYWGGVINTAIGQIGSVIIANNNFSNIEKISVSTTISTYFAKNDNISDIN